MEHHIGVDIVEISRIKEALNRWGDRFLKRVYTDSELHLCGNRVESLAARFAGKEAVMKAISQTGFFIGWKDIEILKRQDGKPLLRLHGQAQKIMESIGVDKLSLCLSHSADYAIAFVIGTSE